MVNLHPYHCMHKEQHESCINDTHSQRLPGGAPTIHSFQEDSPFGGGQAISGWRSVKSGRVNVCTETRFVSSWNMLSGGMVVEVQEEGSVKSRCKAK